MTALADVTSAIIGRAGAGPLAPAVAAADGQLDYAALERESRRVASALIGLGVRAGDRVAVSMTRSCHAVSIMLGIWRAGCVYVPLDPDCPPARRGFMLARAGAAMLIHDAEAEPAAAGCVLRHAASLLSATDGDAERRPGPDACAYVIFTSGSTGEPKGVQISHRNLAAYCRAVAAFLGRPDGVSWASVSPLWTDLGHTAIFGALTAGGCLHLVPERVYMSPRALGRYVTANGVDCLKITPAHLGAVLGEGNAEVLPRELVVLGGEICTWGLIRHIRQLAAGLEVVNHYGPAECTVGVAAFHVPVQGQDDSEGPAAARSREDIVPVGRALPGVRLSVRDGTGALAAAGQPGELWVGGPTVGRYLPGTVPPGHGFVSGGSGPAQPSYRTGDRAVAGADGSVVILGRLDRQLKIRGTRVEPAEVEGVLRGCPGIRDVAVLGIPAAGHQVDLAAVLVAGPGAHVTGRDVQLFAREHLPEALVPTRIALRRRLPIDPAGKLDHRQLAAEFERREPVR
jgi:amino acid adenylation domain-containing protein